MGRSQAGETATYIFVFGNNQKNICHILDNLRPIIAIQVSADQQDFCGIKTNQMPYPTKNLPAFMAGLLPN
ncbi:hypothetical protein HED22_19125 [Thalassospira sp. HF15]|uniref:hypothetical protein n=1 Tax=Thalassospira sp. HF15 TaxID=2722755 RepID=UPI0014318A7F|nr:hypothetical protein [Thalassospira sp. HF15]NIY77771.1 hypothetical protein [Thalassospira sp. HF15]